ncbi:MAG: glyoxalase [Bacteroidia bacterium]
MVDTLYNRDEVLVSLRPSINANSDTFNLLESFQNKTIRPIIKLQSNLLLRHIKAYIKKNKPYFNNLNFEAQKQYIAQILKSDIRLKTELISFVVALFTTEEQEFYLQNQNALNKRITEILYSRCVD